MHETIFYYTTTTTTTTTLLLHYYTHLKIELATYLSFGLSNSIKEDKEDKEDMFIPYSAFILCFKLFS